jgi:hypothetical protein
MIGFRIEEYRAAHRRNASVTAPLGLTWSTRVSEDSAWLTVSSGALTAQVNPMGAQLIGYLPRFVPHRTL